jgi:hypothetical protein
MSENGSSTATLGKRLGVITHISPLRMKVVRLMRQYPAPGKQPLPEDWLVDVAISRGLRQFVRDTAEGQPFTPPSADEFPLHELIVALCYTGGLDRPQMVRMAGLLISRFDVDLRALKQLAVMERVELVIAELARAALRCDPQHPRWRDLEETFSQQPAPRSPVIHWSRLAEPITGPFHRIEGWRLAT